MFVCFRFFLLCCDCASGKLTSSNGMLLGYLVKKSVDVLWLFWLCAWLEWTCGRFSGGGMQDVCELPGGCMPDVEFTEADGC